MRNGNARASCGFSAAKRPKRFEEIGLSEGAIMQYHLVNDQQLQTLGVGLSLPQLRAVILG